MWWRRGRGGGDRDADDVGPDPRVREAFAAVPREEFLRERDRGRPGQRVLDVGSGSGWTTALLATLVGPGGSVLGLEAVPEIAAWGAQNLRAHAAGRTGLGRATIEVADPAHLGRAEAGPWDRILVSAMARTLPDPLVDQLTDDGRMVCPVDGQMLLVQRRENGSTITGHGAYRFVPLRTPPD